MSFMLVFAPFSFVLGTASVIRLITNRPIFYHAIMITNKSYVNDNKELLSIVSKDGFTYAKIKQNACLYKTSDISNHSFNNVYYILPESYFVVILDKINSLIYKAQYINQVGYISSEDVEIVDFIPTVQFLENITFDILENVGTQLRHLPTASANENIKVYLPAGTSNITYIASINGEIPTGGFSGIWYYCLYSPNNDPTSVYDGYVYSEKTRNLSTIPPNLEGEISINTKDDTYENKVSINKTIKSILIIFICLPIILVFVLLVLQNKRNKKKTGSTTEDFLDKNFLSKNENESKNDNENITLKKNGKFCKVDELRGCSLSRKTTKHKFVDIDEQLPSFPAYEIVDDDDLL